MITAAEGPPKEVEGEKVVINEEPIVQTTKTSDTPNGQPGRYS